MRFRAWKATCGAALLLAVAGCSRKTMRKPLPGTAAPASLQGVWRLVSMTMKGRPVGSSESHLVFAGERTWTISGVRPVRYDDESREESTWELDGSRIPVLTVRTTSIEPAGAATKTRTERARVDLDGDQLRIAWQDHQGHLPDLMSDDPGRLEVYARETDPSLVAAHGQPPQAVPRQQLSHPVLGTLRWDANFDEWEASVDLAGTATTLHITGTSPADPATLDRAQRVVEQLRDGKLKVAYGYAAAHLLALYNDTWRESGPRLDAAAFTARLSPESVSIDADGAVELYLDDGDLFAGHTIIVRLDAMLKPHGDPEIAG